MKKLLRNRKGMNVSEEMPNYIHRMIFTVIVIFSIYFLMRAFIMTSVQVGPLEASILANYPHLSEEGFSSVDPTTGRVYQGVIDTAKFTTAQLGELFSADKPQMVGRFLLNQTIIDYLLAKKDPVRAYSDEERYRLWQPIAQSGGRGEGRKTPYPDVRHVSTADGKSARLETVFIYSG